MKFFTCCKPTPSSPKVDFSSFLNPKKRLEGETLRVLVFCRDSERNSLQLKLDRHILYDLFPDASDDVDYTIEEFCWETLVILKDTFHLIWFTGCNLLDTFYSHYTMIHTTTGLYLQDTFLPTMDNYAEKIFDCLHPEGMVIFTEEENYKELICQLPIDTTLTIPLDTLGDMLCHLRNPSQIQFRKEFLEGWFTLFTEKHIHGHLAYVPKR